MASIAPSGAILNQRSSIAARNAGAKLVAPRMSLATATRGKCRRNAFSGRRASVVATASRRTAVPVYATASLQALGTSLIQKAAKAAKPGIFIVGRFLQFDVALIHSAEHPVEMHTACSA